MADPREKLRVKYPIPSPRLWSGSASATMALTAEAIAP